MHTPTASLDVRSDDTAFVADHERGLDAAGLAALFDTHAVAVARCAERLLGAGPHIEDIVQEVFLVAWRRRDEVVRHPRAWLLAVCLHRVQHDIRSRARRRGLLERLLSRAVEPEPHNVAALVERHEHRERLRGALRLLDEDARTHRGCPMISGSTSSTRPLKVRTISSRSRDAWWRLQLLERALLQAAQASSSSSALPRWPSA